MIASGSGPDRSPVSSVPADKGDSGFESDAVVWGWDCDGPLLLPGRFSLRPTGAGRSSFESWLAIPPGVMAPEIDPLLSGVSGGFIPDMLCVMRVIDSD